jgi:TM2 domain-containing membrane protein YozV
MLYNSFLTFLFSLVPGGGQMYMGLMKRGMQIMALFFATFTLTVVLDIPSIGVPLILLVWFYNFFDTIHIRRSFRDSWGE